MLKVLDLFAGCGGMSLGLHRTGGFTTTAFCEIEPYAQKVLAKNFPGVPCFDDVATADFTSLGPVDLVAAGFPCQDISFAGKGAGLAGDRSGLFWHVIRTVGMVGRPQLLLENVAGLLNRGMGAVLGAMASIGYDAEWHCIPASAVGAPHRRDRVWIVADPERDEQPRQEPCVGPFGRMGPLSKLGNDGGKVYLADPYEVNAQGQQPSGVDAQDGQIAGQRPTGPRATGAGGFWAVEPDVGRVADGIPARVDRLAALGNAVVPQIPKLIGHAILNSRTSGHPRRPVDGIRSDCSTPPPGIPRATVQAGATP